MQSSNANNKGATLKKRTLPSSLFKMVQHHQPHKNTQKGVGFHINNKQTPNPIIIEEEHQISRSQPIARGEKEQIPTIQHHQNNSQAKRDFKFVKKRETQSQKNLGQAQIDISENVEDFEKREMLEKLMGKLPKELQPLVKLYSDQNKQKAGQYSIIEIIKSYSVAKELVKMLENITQDQELLNIDKQWSDIVQATSNYYAMLDSESFAEKCWKNESSKESEQMNNLIFKFKEDINCANKSSVYCSMIKQLLQLVLTIEKLRTEESASHQYCVIMKIKGENIYGETINFYTSSLDVRQLLFQLIIISSTSDSELKQESLKKFWKMIGYDISYLNQTVVHSLVDLHSTSFYVQRLKGLEFKDQASNPMIDFIQPQPLILSTLKLTTETTKSLYAISRARIQYLGQNIPIFKFQHSLFEALISAIHPEEVTPEGIDNLTDLTQKDLQRQESFLYRKFLEFQVHPSLDQLLRLSASGKTEEFITAFNALTEEEHKDYSKIKLSLYDINQRMFIIDQTAHPKKGFIVHYNGYVFGTNHAKMFTIREREIGLHGLEVSSEEDSQESSELIVQIDSANPEEELNGAISRKKGQIKRIENPTAEHFEIGIEQDDMANSGSDSEGSSSSEQDYSSGDNIGGRGDDIVSEVDMRTAFVMSSNVLKTNNRRRKLLSHLPKDPNPGNVTSGSGLLAFKIEFSKIESQCECTKIEQRTSQRIVCYGYFPWITSSNRISQRGATQQASHIYKVFNGPNAHISFALWLLQNVINYRRDSRQHTRFVNIFTLNGSHKELPQMLRAFISVVGRDVHFIGDLNKLKLVWYENIKIFDIQNFFPEKSLNSLAKKWLDPGLVEAHRNSAKGDQITEKVLLTYEFAFRYIDELSSIAFNNGRSFYDFTLHGQASASSLALSVFQYLYLDKQHIKGTNEIEIYEKEKQSLKGAFFTINNMGDSISSEELQFSLDQTEDTLRLYEIKHSMPSCFKDFPIPFEYVKKRDLQIDFKFEQGQYMQNYRFQQSLDIWNPETGSSFKLMYTSLYKVDKLEKLGYCFILPSQTSFGLDVTARALTNEYIWGAELIHALIERGHGHSIISHLVISEEISYLQGKVFSSFVTDIWDKYRYSTNKCQRDILEMILEQFPQKFTQKYFGLQQVIHINDLLLMKQTCFQNGSDGSMDTKPPIQKLFELSYPYYYIEYYPQGSDQLQQICSLVRISSYINACHRIRLFQQLQQFEGANSMSYILYLDHQYLLLKNRMLIHQDHQKLILPQASKQSGIEQIGKYRLILEANQSAINQMKSENQEMNFYVDHFKKKCQFEAAIQLKETSHESPSFNDKQTASILKVYNLYRFLAKKSLPEEVTEEKLVDNFTKIVLSSTVSAYLNAPIICETLQKHQIKSQLHSQRNIHSQDVAKGNAFAKEFGTKLEQAQELRELFQKAFLLEDKELKHLIESQNQDHKATQKGSSQKQYDTELIKSKDLHELLIHTLRESMTFFENLLALQQLNTLQPHNSEEYLDSLSQSSHCLKGMPVDSDSSSNLMSQQELMMALKCCEDSSSQGSFVGKDIVALAKQSNGNLVSEFFSQNYTR